jgi:hypothetical protein
VRRDEAIQQVGQAQGEQINGFVHHVGCATGALISGGLIGP